MHACCVVCVLCGVFVYMHAFLHGGMFVSLLCGDEFVYGGCMLSGLFFVCFVL